MSHNHSLAIPVELPGFYIVIYFFFNYSIPMQSLLIDPIKKIKWQSFQLFGNVCLPVVGPFDRYYEYFLKITLKKTTDRSRYHYFFYLFDNLSKLRTEYLKNP